MTKIIQIGNICKGKRAWDNPSAGRVYDQKGLAPTLTCAGGGSRQPYIVEEVKKDEENHCGYERQI